MANRSIRSSGVVREIVTAVSAPEHAASAVSQHPSPRCTRARGGVVGLDFADADAARAFRTLLELRVWSDPASSPALRGTPIARVLVDASA